MDFTPTNFPTMGVSEKEFLDKMIELAKAGDCKDRKEPFRGSGSPFLIPNRLPKAITALASCSLIRPVWSGGTFTTNVLSLSVHQ